MAKKVFVIGLDCAPPKLVFDEWRSDLPNLNSLISRGIHGPLASTIPPITVPAWMSMVTGADPGQLGLYGFRNRQDHSYDKLFTANAMLIRYPKVWDILGRHGKKSVVLGVPLTYPPKPLNGCLAASFLAPDTKSRYTFPESFARELDEAADGYMIDVENFRTDDKERLLNDIHVMTEKRFKAVRYCIKEKEWDFFMFVEMGVDRIHHGFWKYFSPDHPDYEPGNPLENAIHDYYVALDKEIGTVLELLDDDTTVMVVSDHGAKTMLGGLCVNEWLQQAGYLTLIEQPAEPIKLTTGMIDWSRTKAWGEGGYYARIFMNVAGREPEGIIPADRFEAERGALKAALEAIPDENGKPLNTIAYKPQEIYKECKGTPPDLVTYFGMLDWRSVGTVGTGTLYVHENDTGPDDANHDTHGIYIYAPPGRNTGDTKDAEIYDVMHTVLHEFGIASPANVNGKTIE